MPVVDINGEWSQFRLNFSRRHCDRLKNRYGIHVIKSWHRTPTIGIGVARIETDGKLFSPCEGGRPAIILPTNLLADGMLEDQLAFFPDDPDRWWLRLGVAKWLNEWPLMVRQRAWISRPLFLREPFNAYNDRATVDPLNIYSNGLAILRGCFDGAMPLTNDAWPDLNNISTQITFESVEQCRHAQLRIAGKHPELTDQLFIRREQAA